MAEPFLDNQAICDRIAYMISKLQITEASFADSVGISRSTINGVLNGKSNVTLQTVRSILDTYKEWSKYWLLFGEGSPLCADNCETSAASLFTSVVTPSESVIEERLATIIDLVRPAEQEKRIEEIRVFYTDGSYEVFRRQ